MEKKQVLQKMTNLIYYGRLNEAWDLALANPVVHPGKNKPIVGVKSQSGKWIVVLPVVNKANSTMEQRKEYYNQFDKTMVSPQLEGNRFIFLT